MARETDDKNIASDRPRELIVQRDIKAPLRDVWKAISTEDGLVHWWARMSVEAKKGGQVRQVSDDQATPTEEPPLDGAIKRWDEPHTLEIYWNVEDAVAGTVRFDLVELNRTTTRVILTRSVPVSAAVGLSGANCYAKAA